MSQEGRDIAAVILTFGCTLALLIAVVLAFNGDDSPDDSREAAIEFCEDHRGVRRITLNDEGTVKALCTDGAQFVKEEQ